MDCDQRVDQIIAYAAGDLADPERGELRAHLARGCPRCAGLLVEIREVIGLLPEALDPVAVPATVQTRLMERVRSSTRSHVTPAPGALAPIRGVAPERGSGAGRRWLWGALAACLLVAVSAGAAWFTRAKQGEDRVTSLENALAQRDTRIDSLEGMLSATDELVALSSETQPQARARVFWDRKKNIWHFYAFDLKPLPPGKTYELWLIGKDQRKTPAGLFSVNASGSGKLRVAVPPGVGPVAAAAVTDEPASGSPQPTGKIQLLGAAK